MKKILAFSLFTFTFSLLSQAEPSYLWYEVTAYNPEGWTHFDIARIGVANAEGVLESVYLANVVDASTTVPFVESDATKSEAYGWADLSVYASADYWFYVEAYKDGLQVLDYDPETAVNYSDILAGNHISSNIEDPLTASITPWVVPEPTSGFLLLLGLASLALRRKKTRSVLTFSLFTFTFSFFLSAFGGPDDTLVSFSTKGPDTYLDGTVVKDGECYALVWTKSGATFAGIAADGKAVGSDSEVLVFAPIAKDGHCPPALFEIDAMLAKKYADGSFSIYLLDTRLANGAVGGVSAGGVPVAVNGYGAAKSGEATSSSLQGMEDDSSDRSGQETASPLVRVTTRSALPADTPKPQITAIKIVGDKVFLTVKNTIPCLQYVANEVKVEGQGQGGESSTVNLQPSTSTFSPAQGASKADEEIVVIAPKKGDSGFFSVGRK